MSKIDFLSLQRLAKFNESSQKVFDSLSSLSSGEYEPFVLEPFAEKLAVSMADVLSAFKGLEALGMGSVVLGRDNAPTKFIPGYSLKAIGCGALHGEKAWMDKAKEATPSPAPEEKKEKPKSAFDRASFMRERWKSGVMKKGKHKKNKQTHSSVDRSKAMKEMWAKKKAKEGTIVAPEKSTLGISAEVFVVSRIVDRYNAFLHDAELLLKNKKAS